jgi:hypothetical protein
LTLENDDSASINNAGKIENESSDYYKVTVYYWSENATVPEIKIPLTLSSDVAGIDLVASSDSWVSFDTLVSTDTSPRPALLKIAPHTPTTSPMEIEFISADKTAVLATLKTSFVKVEPKVNPSSLQFVVGSPDVSRLLKLTTSPDVAKVEMEGLERKGTPNKTIAQSDDLFAPSTTGITRGVISSDGNASTLTLKVASGGPSAAATGAFILKTSAFTLTDGSLKTTVASSDAYPGAEFSVKIDSYSLDLKKGGAPLVTYSVPVGVPLTAAESFDVVFSSPPTYTVTPVFKISDDLTLTSVGTLPNPVTWKGITFTAEANRVRLSGTPTVAGTREFAVYAQGNGGTVLASKNFKMEVRSSTVTTLSFTPPSLSLVKGEYAYRLISVSPALTGLKFGNGSSRYDWNGLTFTVLSPSSFALAGAPLNAIPGSIPVTGTLGTGTVATGVFPISVHEFSEMGREGTALNRYPFVNGTRVPLSPFVVESETSLTFSFLVEGVGVRGPLSALLVKQSGGQVHLNVGPSFGPDNGSVLIRLPALDPSWYTLYLSYTQGGKTYYQQFYFRAGEAGGGSSPKKDGGGGGCSTAGWGFLAALALVGFLRKKF